MQDLVTGEIDQTGHRESVNVKTSACVRIVKDWNEGCVGSSFLSRQSQLPGAIKFIPFHIIQNALLKSSSSHSIRGKSVILKRVVLDEEARTSIKIETTKNKPSTTSFKEAEAKARCLCRSSL
mmetsp:Transcript_43618/g.132761  ORF Transcript_43618/g.132761 Transcript_43618/m.132761 type:complete len:123 (-) Transcript_43618:2015-2383(-)